MEEEIQHFAHECALNFLETSWEGICNMCYKEISIAYTCYTCEFDLCKLCSKLSPKLFHTLHPQHPLEFCLGQPDHKPGSFICDGCGFFSSGSCFECQECQIKLDLTCASMELVRRWESKQIYHYSHRHMLSRCRPGPDVSGSCLMCELPVSEVTVCYGCVYCLCFVHERCIDLPREIQHPVHASHPLRRLDYMQHREREICCNACQDLISGVPFGCVECDFNLHVGCADSLLRCLKHDSHRHALFYVARNARYTFSVEKPCQICKKTNKIFKDSYYRCVECDSNFHFECLKIRDFVLNRSRHLHPVWCKLFMVKDGSWEYYCDVCEAILYVGSQAYLCKECDFLAHIECILRKEEPSPMYLRCLYSPGEDVTQAKQGTDAEISQCSEENKLVIDDITHTHLLRFFDTTDLDEDSICNMCRQMISGSAYKCKTCEFQAHKLCAELRQQSTHRLHQSHPLTLLPVSPKNKEMVCDNCKRPFDGFNLFCRTCDFVIDIRCATQDRGLMQKVKSWKGNCMQGHKLVQALGGKSKPLPCGICGQKLYGKAPSCLECREIYHVRCLELAKEVQKHPLHPHHPLVLQRTIGPRCAACEGEITCYSYSCRDCQIQFHIECTNSVIALLKIRSHEHDLYHFWPHGEGTLHDDSKLALVCNVCSRPCGGSFYRCIQCNFNTHVECLGLPAYVKHQSHFHALKFRRSLIGKVSYDPYCAICELEFNSTHPGYTCKNCNFVAHIECITSTDYLGSWNRRA